MILSQGEWKNNLNFACWYTNAFTSEMVGLVLVYMTVFYTECVTNLDQRSKMIIFEYSFESSVAGAVGKIGSSLKQNHHKKI